MQCQPCPSARFYGPVEQCFRNISCLAAEFMRRLMRARRFLAPRKWAEPRWLQDRLLRGGADGRLHAGSGQYVVRVCRVGERSAYTKVVQFECQLDADTALALTMYFANSKG